MIAVSTEEQESKFIIRQKTAMPLLWLGIVSIVMVFASLTSAVIVSKGSREWYSFEMPMTFTYSTIIIALSSLTYWFAYRAAKKDQLSALKNNVLITFVLGLLFALFQFISWNQMVDQGIYFAGASSTISGSYLYILSGLHLAHMLGGLISLAVVYVKAGRSVYNSKNLLGLQLSSTYWHFLGGLWVYLYIFLNFIAL